MTPAERESPAPRRLVPELVLILVTILWGGTFLVTKIGLAASGPLFFVATRFAVAAVVLAIVSPSALRGWRRIDLVGSGLIGLAMIAGYAFQTIGLATIPSSTSAFLTALYVPLVPVLALLFLGRRPPAMVWVGIAMAFAGLVLLAGPAAIVTLTLGRGEVASIISALAFAVQILMIGVFANRIDARRAALVQLAIVGIGCFALMPVTGETIPDLTPSLLWPVVILGIASAIIQVAMNWGQRHVAASRATLIYAAEPVYAGIIGRFAGERMSDLGVVGAVLIVASVIVSELKPRTPRN